MIKKYTLIFVFKITGGLMHFYLDNRYCRFYTNKISSLIRYFLYYLCKILYKIRHTNVLETFSVKLPVTYKKVVVAAISFAVFLFYFDGLKHSFVCIQKTINV